MPLYVFDYCNGWNHNIWLRKTAFLPYFHLSMVSQHCIASECCRTSTLDWLATNVRRAHMHTHSVACEQRLILISTSQSEIKTWSDFGWPLIMIWSSHIHISFRNFISQMQTKQTKFGRTHTHTKNGPKETKSPSDWQVVISTSSKFN